MAIAFICQLASGLNSAVGSLLSPERLMTPSTPSSAGGNVAHVGNDSSIRSRKAASDSSPKYRRSSTRTR